MQKNHGVLVFSIALNGYQWLYRDFLTSHQQFASRHGYDYQAVTRPYFTVLGVECCWLKLTLIQQALRNGYRAVMFIDADAYVHSRAPNLESMLNCNASVFMAKGYTGRYNSGVLVVKNNLDARNWINTILRHRHTPVCPNDSVGWGENGHVIKFSRHAEFVLEIDKKWNNTDQPAMEDYITHCNFGPLRQSFLINLIHKGLSRVTRVLSKMSASLRDQSDRMHDLSSLTHNVVTKCTKFRESIKE